MTFIMDTLNGVAMFFGHPYLESTTLLSYIRMYVCMCKFINVVFEGAREAEMAEAER